MKKWLFNPFVYVAGTKALVIGWAGILVTAVIGYFSKTHFDGVLDAHTGHSSPLWFYLEDAIVDWSLPVAIFYISGRIFSKSSIRFIDVAGTLAFARWVMLFPALIGFCVYVPESNHPTTVDELIKRSMTAPVILSGLVGIAFVAWMVALMHNAFTTSCNLKGSKAVWSFVIGLIVAEILSKIILQSI